MCQITLLNNGIGEPTWGLTVVCFLKFYIFQLVLVLFVMISKLRFHVAFIILAILALQAEAVHKQPRWEIQSKFSNFKALDSREHSWNIENRWKSRALQHNWFIDRCPAVKTVPYACAPGATDTSQCIYGEHKLDLIKGWHCKQVLLTKAGSYHGTFSLAAEASPHCPKAMGFSGLENSNLGDQHEEKLWFFTITTNVSMSAWMKDTKNNNGKWQKTN